MKVDFSPINIPTPPNPFAQENLSFIKNSFVPCSNLFPNWEEARELLEDLCSKANHIIVKHKMPQPNINISLGIPFVEDNADKGMVSIKISVIKTYPKEHRDKIVEILESVCKDYSPLIYLKKYLFEPADELLVNNIKSTIDQFEHYIISEGGRSLEDEMKFRFGIFI